MLKIFITGDIGHFGLANANGMRATLKSPEIGQNSCLRHSAVAKGGGRAPLTTASAPLHLVYSNYYFQNITQLQDKTMMVKGVMFKHNSPLKFS